MWHTVANNEGDRSEWHMAMGPLLEKRRPPAHIRSKVDIECRINGASVEVVEIRPKWDNPNQTIEHGIAKATYVKSRGHWRVYWLRQDLKWHRYDPAPEVPTLRAFAQLVAEDKHACFFG